MTQTVAVEQVDRQTLENAIHEFVKIANAVSLERHTASGFTAFKADTHAVDINDAWAKVWTYRNQNDGTSSRSSIYAFISLTNKKTKTLGQLKIGDVHKPASTAAPAKHARGNVLSADGGRSAISGTGYGVAYLK